MPVLKEAGIKPRLIKELQFNQEVLEHVSHSELTALPTRSGNGGVLLFHRADSLNALPFTLIKKLVDKQTGRSKPIICDFCYTQQASGKGARITFPYRDGSGSISYLCCLDLKCSDHVRDKTEESKESRKQLRENLTIEQRIERLELNLEKIIRHYELRI